MIQNNILSHDFPGSLSFVDRMKNSNFHAYQNIFMENICHSNTPQAKEVFDTFTSSPKHLENILAPVSHMGCFMGYGHGKYWVAVLYALSDGSEEGSSYPPQMSQFNRKSNLSSVETNSPVLPLITSPILSNHTVTLTTSITILPNASIIPTTNIVIIQKIYQNYSPSPIYLTSNSTPNAVKRRNLLSTRSFSPPPIPSFDFFRKNSFYNIPDQIVSPLSSPISTSSSFSIPENFPKAQSLREENSIRPLIVTISNIPANINFDPAQFISYLNSTASSNIDYSNI